MKTTLRRIQAWLYLVLKDLRVSFPLPLTRKIALWRKGFLAEKHVLYRLDLNDANDYLSDHQAAMARSVNEPFNELLTNKFVFEKTCGLHIRTPKVYGIVINGIYYPEPAAPSLELLSEHGRQIVVKSVTGGGGKGVYIVAFGHDGTVSANGRNLSRNEWVKFLGSLDNYIVTEYIKQGEFPKSLNEGTVNTMRILTLVDPLTRQPFIARAVQRIGVTKSAPMDNFTKGGLSVSIDTNSGMLGEGAMHPHSPKFDRYSQHPETGVVFKGRQIPEWGLVSSRILQASAALPMLKCIGWDVLISSGDVVAIEGNHHPDPDVLQAHEPLLIDERIRRFYWHHGIVS